MGKRKMRIIGPFSLQGEVSVAGAKNASLPELSATLLSDQPVLLENIPQVEDIESMVEALRHLGVKVSVKTSGMELLADELTGHQVPAEVVGISRASILILAPLLARMGRARVSLPQGCPIGDRNINFHLAGLKALGAQVMEEDGYIVASCARLQGNRFRFPQKSVTGTENLIMAASQAHGETVLENCALEPEIGDLIQLLNTLGAEIEVLDDTIHIQGCAGQPFHGGRHTVIPDRIEAGTWLIAGAFRGNSVRVRNANPSHIQRLVDLLDEMGADVSISPAGISVTGQNLRPLQIATEAFPGFPTDLQAQMMVLLTQADGVSRIRETIFEKRLQHAIELNKMGAKIAVTGDTAQISGSAVLHGNQINATDLRASAALLLAATQAKGETIINNVRQLFRGYQDLPQKIISLGAKLEIFQAQEE